MAPWDYWQDDKPFTTQLQSKTARTKYFYMKKVTKKTFLNLILKKSFTFTHIHSFKNEWFSLSFLSESRSQMSDTVLLRNIVAQEQYV